MRSSSVGLLPSQPYGAVSVTPTLADWQAVSLPPPLAFLYHGVRPVRLLGKYLRLTGSTDT